MFTTWPKVCISCLSSELNFILLELPIYMWKIVYERFLCWSFICISDTVPWWNQSQFYIVNYKTENRSMEKLWSMCPWLCCWTYGQWTCCTNVWSYMHRTWRTINLFLQVVGQLIHPSKKTVSFLWKSHSCRVALGLISFVSINKDNVKNSATLAAPKKQLKTEN